MAKVIDRHAALEDHARHREQSATSSAQSPNRRKDIALEYAAGSQYASSVFSEMASDEDVKNAKSEADKAFNELRKMLAPTQAIAQLHITFGFSSPSLTFAWALIHSIS